MQKSTREMQNYLKGPIVNYLEMVLLKEQKQ